MLLAALVSLSGCATDGNSSKASPTGSGLAEYSQLVRYSRNGVESVLQSLEKVRGQPAPCPRGVLEAFSKQVDNIAAQSIQVRARAAAMQTRGDAYFENWRANLARVSDPAVREHAEQHREDLQQGLARIKVHSLNTRESFQKFLTGLRDLRGTLEKDPTAMRQSATLEGARLTEQSGREVEQNLDRIAEEVKMMGQVLALKGSVAKERYERNTAPNRY